jgi:hypothetical protein
MPEYVKFDIARSIICVICAQAYPDEDCPTKCDWMDMLKCGCKKDGE